MGARLVKLKFLDDFPQTLGRANQTLDERLLFTANPLGYLLNKNFHYGYGQKHFWGFPGLCFRESTLFLKGSLKRLFFGVFGLCFLFGSGLFL